MVGGAVTFYFHLLKILIYFLFGCGLICSYLRKLHKKTRRIFVQLLTKHQIEGIMGSY